MVNNIYATKAYRLGNSGENKIIQILDSINEPEFNLHNIMLLDEKGNTHQIDIICVSRRGVFVIEVKNVCGYKIRCENDLTYWEYDWIKEKKLITCKLYNPILQNIAHVREVKKFLDNYPVRSLITFSNNNILEHKKPLNDIVVNMKNIREYIQKFPECISDEDRIKIKKAIEKHNHKEISLKEHIENTKGKKTKK